MRKIRQFCIKFGYLIFGKTIELVATRCQTFKAKTHQIQSRLGLRPDHPAGKAYSAPPDPLDGFKEPTFKGETRKGGKWEGRENGEGKGGERKEGMETDEEDHAKGWQTPPCSKS